MEIRLTIDGFNYGMTETSNYNRSYVHPTKKIIEVSNVRRNPKVRREVYFVSVKNIEDLKELCSNMDTPITSEDIKHNEFAIAGFQLIK